MDSQHVIFFLASLVVSTFIRKKVCVSAGINYPAEPSSRMAARCFIFIWPPLWLGYMPESAQTSMGAGWCSSPYELIFCLDKKELQL